LKCSDLRIDGKETSEEINRGEVLPSFLMALEPSEVMTAGALFFTNSQLDKALESTDALGQFIEEAKKKVEKHVEFGSSRNEFLSFMNVSPAMMKEMVYGISAAKGVKKWVTRDHKIKNDSVAEKVFLTGNVWPKEVEPFRVQAYGFDDYNSSDLIYKPADKKYFGVSLKKKPKPNSQDPTLINKAFNTVLEGPEFKETRDEIDNIRITYFAGQVRQAHEDGILYIPNIHNLPDEELFYGKKRDKKIFKRPYPNTKGSLSGGYDNDKAPDAMRKFLNDDLAKPNNILWKSLTGYMNQHANIFAESLINLVLKVKLYDELAAKKVGGYTFGFALVTGMGEIKKGKPIAYDGKAIDLHTILCGLSDLQSNKSKYEIEVDIEKKLEATAAKTFFKLSKAGVPILDMELRYKGDKTPQPQFLGTITKEFQEILTKKCLVPGADGAK